MSSISSLTHYLHRILHRHSGLKCLLLDVETITMIGINTSWSHLISSDVVMVERIDGDEKMGNPFNGNQNVDDDEITMDMYDGVQKNNSNSLSSTSSSLSSKFHYLHPIVIIRPTLTNVQYLRSYLSSSKYKNYSIYFTNIVPNDLLSTLASIDTSSLITHVEEVFIDYYTISPHCFHSNCYVTKPLLSPPIYYFQREKAILLRHIQSIIAFCLSQKRKPDVRVVANNEICSVIGIGIMKIMREEGELFAFQHVQKDKEREKEKEENNENGIHNHNNGISTTSSNISNVVASSSSLASSAASAAFATTTNALNNILGLTLPSSTSSSSSVSNTSTSTSSSLNDQSSSSTSSSSSSSSSHSSHSHSHSTPLLLILDRRDDPLTPLLSQWTYQSMIHELIGIHHSRVNLSSLLPEDSKVINKNNPNKNDKNKSKSSTLRNELREIVLNTELDSFYRGSSYLNFGDLGSSIKNLLNEYQRKTKITSKIDSIEDMQRFVDLYPDFRAMSGNVSKHMTLVSEMSKIIKQRDLMYISEIEQEMACNEDMFGSSEKLMKVLTDHHVKFIDKLRCCLLYIMRYEESIAGGNPIYMQNNKNNNNNSYSSYIGMNGSSSCVISLQTMRKHLLHTAQQEDQILHEKKSNAMEGAAMIIQQKFDQLTKGKSESSSSSPSSSISSSSSSSSSLEFSSLSPTLSYQRKLSHLSLLEDIMKHSGIRHRTLDLYGNSKGLLARATQFISSGIRGIENIFTQHKPLISEILGGLISGKLNPKAFVTPSDSPSPTSSSSSLPSSSPLPSPLPIISSSSSSTTFPHYRHIYLYIVGGITYEEVSYVEQFNRNISGFKIYLGGSAIHNSNTFMNEIQGEKYRDTSLFMG